MASSTTRGVYIRSWMTPSTNSQKKSSTMVVLAKTFSTNFKDEWTRVEEGCMRAVRLNPKSVKGLIGKFNTHGL